MLKKALLLCIATCSALHADYQVAVIPHSQLTTYAHHGNTLTGVATVPLGVDENEVWRSSLAPGGCTPKHWHESEEVFILLAGSIAAELGGHRYEIEAPATLICPAGVPHQLFNIGQEATDQIVVLRANSRIWAEDGEEMILPWRE